MSYDSGRTVSRRLVNELGNEIEIEVAEYGTEGCVRIRVAGPRSVAEDDLTRLEAEQLRDALVEALS